MAILITGSKYLECLSLHKQASVLATKNPMAAMAKAQEIFDTNVRNDAFKEVITFALKAFNSDEKTIDYLIQSLRLISDPKLKAKLAEKLTRKTEGKKTTEIDINLAQNTRGVRVAEDEKQIALLKTGPFSERFKIVTKIKTPDKREEGYCILAKSLPSNFEMPVQNASEIQQQKTLLFWEIDRIETLPPEEIQRVLKQAKKLIAKAVDSGLPEVGVQIAEKFKEKKIEAATLENGLERAAAITAIYSQSKAALLAAQLTIPKRIEDCAKILEKIALESKRG